MFISFRSDIKNPIWDTIYLNVSEAMLWSFSEISAEVFTSIKVEEY